jgi:AN1-type zinc finger and ubiquitin domain-containing protein 1
MEDTRSLRDYHIQNGATLQLVLAMRGGPVNTRRGAVFERLTVEYFIANSGLMWPFASLFGGIFIVSHCEVHSV